MKKIFITLMTTILIFSLPICFATSGESSGENNTSGEKVEYIDSYEEYQELINSVDDEYKDAYEEFVDMRAKNYNLYERPEACRAKVTKASEALVYYGYYQSIYKATYQNLNIEILDGKYSGKTIENFNYILTVDTYENIKLNKIKAGNIVNVCVYEDEEGNLAAYSLGLDSTVERWPGVLILLIAAIVLMLIYLGAKGAKMLIPLILFVDLAFIVLVPLIFTGVNLFILLAILVVLSAIVISLLKLGGKPRAWVAVLASIVLVFVMTLVVYGVDGLTKMSGITFETTSMSGVFYDLITLYDTPYNAVTLAELVPQKNIDFYSLKLVFEIAIIFFATITIICKTVEIYSERQKDEDKFLSVLKKMKDYSADKIVTILPILLVITIPKYMLLFVNKCSMIEVLNSEVLLADVTRTIFVLIAIALAAPLTTFISMITLDEE